VVAQTSVVNHMALYVVLVLGGIFDHMLTHGRVTVLSYLTSRPVISNGSANVA
jgi:hypothetical protein